jgi:hypothetical protein
MPRVLRFAALVLLLASGLSAGSACGTIAVDTSTGGAPALPDASAPDAAAAPDASTPPDASLAACTDPTACSRLQTHDGCAGATMLGTFCDSFATPCAATLPDCAKLGALLDAPVTPGSCGGGLVLCSVNWTVPSVDQGTLEKLCAASAAVGTPVDCLGD